MHLDYDIEVLKFLADHAGTEFVLSTFLSAVPFSGVDDNDVRRQVMEIIVNFLLGYESLSESDIDTLLKPVAKYATERQARIFLVAVYDQISLDSSWGRRLVKKAADNDERYNKVMNADTEFDPTEIWDW